LSRSKVQCGVERQVNGCKTQRIENRGWTT
jgi:hypothetical protein